MKKYIAPEISLIKELDCAFCEGGLDSSIKDAGQLGYVQLESVTDEMED